MSKPKERQARCKALLDRARAVKQRRGCSAEIIRDEVNALLHDLDGVSVHTVLNWMKPSTKTTSGENALALLDWLKQHEQQEA